MEVIFGVQARDGALRVDIPDKEIDKLKAQLDEAFSGDRIQKLLWVTDKDNRTIGIPIDKLAFVEFGGAKASRTVGFSAAS
ncbi:MAG: DUF3107 family protein [Actinomycetota bacterium]